MTRDRIMLLVMGGLASGVWISLIFCLIIGSRLPHKTVEAISPGVLLNSSARAIDDNSDSNVKIVPIPQIGRDDCYRVTDEKTSWRVTGPVPCPK